jgi:methionyl-tRNA formyltransferase
MGTPEFAVPSLAQLHREHQVVAVYVRPDAVSGRGGSKRFAPVKLAAESLGLTVLQPATLRDPETVDALAALGADVICVAAYGLILPVGVLSAATHGAINVHASLLPRWRGAAPIQRAILAGDAEAGVSIMRMEEGLDTGPYCLQWAVAIGRKSAAELTDELAHLGAELLVAALPHIEDGTAVWTPQKEADVTYAEKVSKSDVTPDPSLSACQNLLRIQASSPAAPARIVLGGKGVTLLRACSAAPEAGVSAGSLSLGPEGILLGADSGAVLVSRLKPDGKGEMDATAWARGARLTSDAVWGSAR